jgi:hypothetical protein
MIHLKMHHEDKIIEMYFHDQKTVVEINRESHKRFGCSQIASIIAISCMTADKEFLTIPSKLNYL